MNNKKTPKNSHQDCFISLQWRWVENGQEYVSHPFNPLKTLRRFLDQLSHFHQNCKVCGGLTPELTLYYNGKHFEFTCVQISDGKKVIAGTDYKKFASYCNNKETARIIDFSQT